MNKYISTGITTTLIWQALLSPAWTQPSPCDLPRVPEFSQNFAQSQSMTNSTQRNVIVIGQVSTKPYVVIVPGNSEQLLNRVRRYANNAFLAQHKLGAYVYVGGYPNRFQAQCWSNLLKSRGLDARVVYFR